MTNSNSKRFINAYNILDTALRNMFNLSSSMGFSDMIRRVSEKNAVIRKYEDDLVAYARLRNAIVHKSINDETIAEPHDDVVERMETIVNIIITPPKALDVFGNRDIIKLSENDTVEKVIYLINKYGFSHFPVMRGDSILGMVNDKVLIRSQADVISKELSLDNFVSTTVVRKIISEKVFQKYYLIFNSNSTLVEVLNAFLSNRDVNAVLITENGTRDEKILALITGGDIIKISEILENY